MILGYEQIAVSSTVKDIASLTVPGGCTHAELQADTQDVRYTMDGETNPTQSVGMVFATAHPPKLFTIRDVRRIRFVRGAGSDGVLNVHYVGGRAS